MSLVKYTGKLGHGMSYDIYDLVCGNCKTFNQAACSSPRCRSSLYPHAQFDSPACHQFDRIPESLGVAPVNLRRFNEESRLERLQSLGYGDAQA